jgi:N-acetylmuramoyl-L-alanine amidase
MNALRLVGYDTHDPRAAVVAFQRHFRASEGDVLDATDAAILASLTR